MKPELNLLVWSVVLTVVQMLVAAQAAFNKAAGKTNDMTLLGAQLFFWARVAYAAIYIAGIIWVRTAAWAVSMAGLIVIFAQLVK